MTQNVLHTLTIKKSDNMVDINTDEYDAVTRGLAEQIKDIRNNDPLAMVQRQLPLEYMQNVVKSDDTLEIVFKFKFPAKNIVKYVEEQRAKK